MVVDLNLRLEDTPALVAGDSLGVENAYPYPSFEAASGTVTVRENLCVNPNFETNAANWIDYSSTSTQSTAFFHSGSASLLVAPSIDSGGVRHQAALTGGVTYTWSAWVYVDGAPKNLRVAAIGTVAVPGPTVLVPANTWMRLSVTFTPAATAPHDLYVFGTDSTTPFYVDDVLLEASPTVNSYFDGNTPAAGDFSYAFTGTANASTSVQTAPGLPSTVSGGARIHWQSGEWAAEGVKSLRIRQLSSADSNGVITVGAGVTLADLGFANGDTVTLVAKVRLAAPQTGTLATHPRSIRVTDVANANIAISAPAPNAAGVHEVRLTYTIQSATGDRIRLTHGADPTNDDIWWDLLTIVEGTYDGPPFSGDTADDPATGIGFRWLGTADESKSEQVGLTPAYQYGDVVGWSITETTVPHVVTDSSGSAGTASVTVRAVNNTYYLTDEQARLTLPGIDGSFTGTISPISLTPVDGSNDPQGVAQLTVPSRVATLAVEREIPPVFQLTLAEIFTTYVQAVDPTYTVTYLATENPVKTYGAWRGNVWTRLKELCAATHKEIAFDGDTVLVRDLGTTLLDLSNHAGVSIVTTPAQGQYVEIVNRRSAPVDNMLVWNLAENPSLETNDEGWGMLPYAGFGSVTAGRVSN